MTETTADEFELKRMPYQGRQPKEMLPDLIVNNAIPDDERIWVPQAEGISF